MPPNDHLTWTEVREFGTLWTRDSQLMPANAAQQMDDCYPQPGGGLRAFMAATNLSTTGLAPTTERALGVYLFAPNSASTLEANAVNTFVVATTGGGTFKLYRGDSVGGAFSLLQTFGTSSGSPRIGAPLFFDYAAGTYFVFTVPRFGSYYHNGGGGVATLLSSTQWARTLHQSRIVALTANAAGFTSTINFTDPGGLTFPVGNTLTIDAKGGPFGALVAATSPSDLFVVMRSGQVYNVQGDLSDPIIREMGSLPRMSRSAPWDSLPSGGIVTMAEGAGVWVIGGGEPNKISDPLDASTFTGEYDNLFGLAGDIGVSDPFVVCPLGYIFDVRTRAWFRSTAFSTVRRFSLDRIFDRSYTSRGRMTGITNNGDATWAMPQMHLAEVDYASRVTSFTWKSAPLRDPNGRRVEIREVQLSLKSYEANAQVTVTVNGVARTVTMPTAGRHNPRFLFRERSEQLDVTVTSTGGAGSAEAPTVESIRIGSMPRQMLRYP